MMRNNRFKLPSLQDDVFHLGALERSEEKIADQRKDSLKDFQIQNHHDSLAQRSFIFRGKLMSLDRTL